MSLPPLSLYIHIPWCVRKCPYCDFNSHEIKEQPDEAQYIERLLSDLRADIPATGERPIHSIFIGGGTPSVFRAESIATLLEGIKQQTALTEHCEITLEANPGTFEQDRYRGYAQAGINRLSVGVQSFDSNHLKALGRIHDQDQACLAIEQALKAGFNGVNIDLMFGLPEQSTQQALADLQQAISFNTAHLSWYQLTIEPNTAFYHSPPPLPEDEGIWDIQEQGQQMLANAGFSQYEVSAYAKPDQQCRHNTNYWQFGDYLGIGAGAHAKLTSASGIKRFHKYRHPKQYMNNLSFIAGENTLGKSDIVYEFMLNALRLKNGVPVNIFEQHSQMPFTAIEHLWQSGVEQGLLSPIEKTKPRLKTTEAGFNFLNDSVNVFEAE